MHTFYIHVNTRMQTHLQMNSYNTYILAYLYSVHAYMVCKMWGTEWSAKYRAQSVEWPIKGHIINAERKVWGSMLVGAKFEDAKTIVKLIILG